MKLLEIPEATIRHELACLRKATILTPFEEGAIASLQWLLTREKTPSSASAARAFRSALTSPPILSGDTAAPIGGAG